MHEEDGLPEKLGRKVNELDIDFSRFTFAGWLVVLFTIGSGVAAGWIAYSNMPQVDGMSRGRALVLGLTGLVTAVVTFLLTRALFRLLGLHIIKSDTQD
jgi:hypothetical protein